MVTTGWTGIALRVARRKRGTAFPLVDSTLGYTLDTSMCSGGGGSSSIGGRDTGGTVSVARNSSRSPRTTSSFSHNLLDSSFSLLSGGVDHLVSPVSVCRQYDSPCSFVTWAHPAVDMLKFGSVFPPNGPRFSMTCMDTCCASALMSSGLDQHIHTDRTSRPTIPASRSSARSNIARPLIRNPPIPRFWSAKTLSLSTPNRITTR